MGSEHVLGEAEDFYGIWDTRTGGAPVERFPRTAEGRMAAIDRLDRLGGGRVAGPASSVRTAAPPLAAPFIAIAALIATIALLGSYEPGLAWVLFLIGAPLLFGWATASLVRSKGGAFSSGFVLGAFLGPLGLILAGLWKPDPRRRPHHSPFEGVGSREAGMAPQVATAFAEAEAGRRRRLWVLGVVVASYVGIWALYLSQVPRGDGPGGTPAQGGLWLLASAGVLAGVVYVMLYPRIRRNRAMRLEAHRLGLRFAPRDPFNLLAIPIPAFQGQRAQLRNVRWGTWRDRDVVVFDGVDGSACLVRVALDCPPMAVYPENRISVGLRASGLRDIELESEEFNRAFTIRCDDRRFAGALLDARLMAWLLEDRSRWGFEMAPGWVFCTGWGERSDDPEALLGTAAAFVERIPRPVWDLYRPLIGP